jgi:peptidoglycan hydrolase-like protein with peptidoglycan-binding domain
MNNIKKVLASTFIASFILGSIPAFATTEGIYDKNLSYGMCDGDVQFLQQYMQRHGYFPASTQVTGYFGPVTLKAVKNMQKSNKISSTGFVGPLTRAFLNAEYEKESTQQSTQQWGQMGTGLILTPKCIYDKIPVAQLPQ